MENNSYHKTLSVNASAKETLQKIAQIHLWWKRDVSGSTQQLNDTFTVPFSAPSFVAFEVSALVPDQKVVWQVTDCHLHWFEDKKEWNHTAVVFELSEDHDKTKVDFTHIGLVPAIACYEVCVKGWDGHLNDLVQFINEGKVLPE